MRPLILASSMRAAHQHARDALSLERGQYRVVTSASTIKSVRNTELHLVPGWERRFDRFAMKSAMRWCHLKIVEAEAEKPHQEPGLFDEKPFRTIFDDRDEKPAVVEEEPREVKRRRRRCKRCGVLVEPDEIEQHLADHLPEGVA